MSQRHYLMCRPTYFAVDYAINPWMDPTVPVDADLAVRQWTSAARHLPRLGHTSTRSTRSRACPTWCSPPTAPPSRRHRLRRPVPLPGAGRRGPGLPELVRRRRLRRPRGRSRSTRARATCSSPAIPARRHRLPHRPRRARRGAGALRPAGHHAAAGRPALLPPRHRARRARRRRTSPTARRRSRPAARRVLRAAVPGRGHRHRRRRRGARPQRGHRRPHVVLPVAGDRAWPEQLRERGYEPVPVDLSELLQGRRRPEVLHPGAEERVMTHR